METSEQVPEVDPQLEVDQLEVTSELELVQLEFDLDTIVVETEDISELEVVHESCLEIDVLLPKHMEFDLEHSKVVTKIPQSSIFPDTPSSTPKVFFEPDSEILPPRLIGV